LTHVTDPQSRFGRYQLVRRIGEGGMAEVFLATCDAGRARTTVVVKRIRPELASTPDMARMLLDEARLLALVDHPNIVRLLDSGQVDGSPFLVMEPLDGKDLATVMGTLRPMGISLRAPVAARIGLAVARGLHHAHTLRDGLGRPCRIVHRDVNPANIMLLRDGGAKVLDFGIAKAADHMGQEQTQIAKVKGKLGYLSPEQARSEPLDGRSDVFSLGITMWEMLTGRRLFTGRSNFERIHNVLHEPIDPPSRHRPAIPPALDCIVMRALERDREQRYASAGEMAADLERFLAVHPGLEDSIAVLVERLPDRSHATAVSASGATVPLGPQAWQGAAPAAAPRRRHSRRRAIRWTAGAGLAVSAMAVLLAILQSGIGAARAPILTTPAGLTASAPGAPAAPSIGGPVAPGAVTVVELVRPRPEPKPLARPRAKMVGPRAGKKPARGRR
jgi:serine/threonine-protein kinase